MGIDVSEQIEMIAGDTYVLSLAFTENSVPVNITGSTILMSAKNQISDSTYLFQQAGVIVSGAGGTASITILPTQTASTYFAPNTDRVNGRFEITRTDASGLISTVIGKILIYARVSN